MTSDKLLERPVSRSVVEEVLGILWAILATLTTSKVIAIIAWSMAGISTTAAIYFAFASLRARSQEGSSNVR